MSEGAFVCIPCIHDTKLHLKPAIDLMNSNRKIKFFFLNTSICEAKRNNHYPPLILPLIPP